MATGRRPEIAPQFGDAAARLFQRRAGVELRHLFEKLLAEPVPETWLAILEDRGEDDQIALQRSTKSVQPLPRPRAPSPRIRRDLGAFDQENAACVE